MRSAAIEEQTIARTQSVAVGAVSINNFTFQHVEKLHAIMMKHRELVGGFVQRNQIRFDDDAAGSRSAKAQKIAFIARTNAVATNARALSDLHEDGCAPAIIMSEK